jgi:TRAP-type uncharacterized transport system fused permease subunit
MEVYKVSEVESGKKESWQPIDMAIATVGVAMAMFHLMSTQYLILGGFEFQNAHLGFALLLVLLTAFKKRGRKGRLLTITLLILSLACIIYVGVLYEELEIRAESNTFLDLVVGVIIIFLVLETTRQSFGWILPTVAIIFIAYAFLGSYIPGALRGAELAPNNRHASIRCNRLLRAGWQNSREKAKVGSGVIIGSNERLGRNDYWKCGGEYRYYWVIYHTADEKGWL